MFGLGFSEMAILLPLLGGFSLPVGLPPAAPDARLANIAPERCLVYIRWAGAAKADPNSKNQTEQLLAEPELHAFCQHMEEVIRKAIAKNMQTSPTAERELALAAPDLAKIILTSPTAIFATEVGAGANGLATDIGLAINVGENKATFAAAIERIEALIGDELTTTKFASREWRQLDTPAGTAVIWGFDGDYFLLGADRSSIQGMLDRSSGQPPKWLAEVEEQLPIERRSSTIFLSVAGVRKAIGLFGALGVPQAEIDNGIKAVGLHNLTHVAIATGLEGEGFISRTLLAFDGEPTGVFSPVMAKPLTHDELRAIPFDATIALAFRLDLDMFVNRAVDVASQFEPRAADHVAEVRQMVSNELGIDLSADVFQSLGDAWRFYNSPGEGGFVATGLTGVVSVRNSDRLVKSIAALEKAVLHDMNAYATPERQSKIERFEYAGQTISHFVAPNEEFFIAPAWCLTDKELIVSLFPSHIKAYLSRPSSAKTLADQPAVAKAMSGSSPPMKLYYQNTPELFSIAYPLLQMGGTSAANSLRREGFDFNIGMFPSAPSIGRHLRPEVIAVSRTEHGIEIVSRQVVPTSGLLPIVSSMASFSVLETREIYRDEIYREEAVPPPAQGAGFINPLRRSAWGIDGPAMFVREAMRRMQLVPRLATAG